MSEANENDVAFEVRAWLKANWNPEQSLIDWRNQARRLRLGHAALAEAVARPRSAGSHVAVRSTTSSSRWVPSAQPPPGPRILASVTLLEHASDAIKQRFLRRIITGEDGWCQLFSEPGSGSDLAGATTRADFDGTQWVDQRPEGLEHERPSCRLRFARGAHRLGRAEAPGSQLLRARHAPARRAGAAAQADERPRVVQSGVLHRRENPGRLDRRREEQRLDRCDDDARARTASAPWVWPASAAKDARAARTTKRASKPKSPTSRISGIRSAPGASTWSSRVRRKPAHGTIPSFARKSPSC